MINWFQREKRQGKPWKGCNSLEMNYWRIFKRNKCVCVCVKKTAVTRRRSRLSSLQHFGSRPRQGLGRGCWVRSIKPASRKYIVPSTGPFGPASVSSFFSFNSPSSGYKFPDFHYSFINFIYLLIWHNILNCFTIVKILIMFSQ